MLGHSEIIIGAPHDHVARPLRGMPDRVREAAGEPLKVGKNPVAALVPEPGKGICKIRLVIHGLRFSRQGEPTLERSKLFLEAFQGSCRGDNERGPTPRVLQSAIEKAEKTRTGQFLSRALRDDQGPNAGPDQKVAPAL